MNNRLFYIGADTQSLDHAHKHLLSRGCNIADTPSEDVTHLMLPIPSFAADGTVNGGGELKSLMDVLPKDITVIGGNLRHLQGYRTVDLLKNEYYLARNALITAECALQIAMMQLPVTLNGTEALILGWGRIAKCLAKLLGAMGAEVSVTARKPADIALASALGYGGFELAGLPPRLARYRLILNTVPAMILPETLSAACRDDCVMIDLASVPGIGGSRVIQARGLPGKMAPESSGKLIANAVIQCCINQEVLP